MLSKRSIKEYQRIVRKDGFELSDEQAQMSAEALLRLYRSLFAVLKEKINQEHVQRKNANDVQKAD